MPLIERNSSNKLFLATATSWNYTDTKAPFLWFLNGINTYNINDFGSLLNHVGEMYEQDTDGSLKQFTNNILHEADINIDNFIFDSREVSPGIFMQQMPPVLRGLFPINPERKNKEYTVSTIHSISNATGTEIYEMPLFEESQGTQNLFMFSPFIKQAFNTGETLCIDELDASLHPMLVIYLVELFNNTDVNKNNAQLIISSHTTSLLSLSVLRRDQIYFVEKDKKTGETSLYSLDEFSPRKSEDIRKAYLLGRYGSVPTIGGEI